jgi:hypothetical protein
LQPLFDQGAVQHAQQGQQAAAAPPVRAVAGSGMQVLQELAHWVAARHRVQHARADGAVLALGRAIATEATLTPLAR